MNRFQWNGLVVAAIFLGTAGTVFAVSLKAGNGSLEPGASGAVTTKYDGPYWEVPDFGAPYQYYVATSKFTCKGLTPGSTYYLWGGVATQFGSDRYPITSFAADATGFAAGTGTSGPEAKYDYYFVEDAVGNWVMWSPHN